MAFSAVIAIAAGETAVTAGLVLAAVSEIGVALTVVGAVTGNKDLMKIGGVMGLVGGVGGLVAGGIGGVAAEGVAEGVASSAAENAASAAASDVGFGAVDMASEAATSGINTTGSVIATPVANPNVVAQPLDTLSSTPQDIISTPQTPAAPSIAADQGLQAPTINEIPTLDTKTPQGVADTRTPFESGQSKDVSANAVKNGSSAPQDSKSFFDSVSSFATKNKSLLDFGGKMIGGAMDGANKADMAAQQNALAQQRIDNERAQTQLKSYGSQVGSYAPRGILSR